MKNIRLSKVYKKAEIFLLLAFLLLAVSAGALYSHFKCAVLSAEGVYAHFSPDLGDELSDFLNLLSKSFYDDAFDVIYVFASSFLFCGRFINIGILAMRGAAFGYNFIALGNTLLHYSGLLSVFEYCCFLAVGLAVNFLIVFFSSEAWIFYSSMKTLYPRRIDVFKSKLFFRYVFDMILICGSIVLFRTLYTLFVIIL